MPERIQRSRQHPWREANPDAVIVDRTTKWGNPFVIGSTYGMTTSAGYRTVTIVDRASAVAEYRRAIELGYSTYFPRDFVARVRSELAGKNLVCWCPLVDDDGDRVPCHADVLLEIANA